MDLVVVKNIQFSGALCVAAKKLSGQLRLQRADHTDGAAHGNGRRVFRRQKPGLRQIGRPPGQIRIGRAEKAVNAAKKAKDEVLEAREISHEEAMATLKENFGTALGQLKAQVKEDTDVLLKARQKEFKDASGEAIGTLLSPLKDKLEDLRKEMSANSDVHKASREAMKTEVDNLMKYTGRVSESTDRLAAAFKYGNKLQGTWGETILEELLSSQGLTAGVHFDVQPTITDAAGNAVQQGNGKVQL